MSKKIISLGAVELAESVDFVTIDISGESSDKNKIFGDPLQDSLSNLEKSKAQTKRVVHKREPVVASNTLHEESPSVNKCMIKKIKKVIVKPEPMHASNEYGKQEFYNVVTPVEEIKREVSEANEVQSGINTSKLTVKTKRFKKDHDSSIPSNTSDKEEPLLPFEPNSVFENLHVKSELIVENDEELQETNETTANRGKSAKINACSYPENMEVRDSMRFRHWNPKVMQKAITEVLEKKMLDTKLEKQFEKVKDHSHDGRTKPSTTEEESESSGSDDTGKRISLKKGPEKPKLAWNPELMILAVNAVRAKKMGCTRAARVFQIPKTTLLKYLNEEMTAEEIIVPCPARGRKKVFSIRQEEDLEKYLLYIQERYFGLTKEEIKSIVLQFTKLQDITSPFGPAGQPGFTWIKAFLRRHSSIVPQNPRETRKHSSVSKFFSLIKREVEANHYSANMIFNVDETAFSIVHSKNPQFRLMKRQEQVMRAKKDSYLTVITCMGAAGNFVPPMFIFPRHKATADLMRGAPPGAVATCHPSGWVQLELFTQWFRHFLNVTKPTKENPALLILDGQQNHTKNVEVIQLAEVNHVSIISLPPLTLNKLQPVYKSFMDPLKTFYSEEVRKWMNQNLRPLSLDVVVELFGKAYLQVLDCNIGIQGFRDTGIMPLNPDMVSEDFPDLEDEDLEGAKVEQFLTHMMDHLSSPDELKSVKLKLKPSTSDALSDTQDYPSLREMSRHRLSDDSFEEDEESDTECTVKHVKSEIKVECMFCRQLQSEDSRGEKWIQCMSCDLWSHDECAGYDASEYICDYCKLNK